MKNLFPITRVLMIALVIFVIISACQGDNILNVDQVDFNPTEIVNETLPAEKVYTQPDDILVMLAEMEKLREERWRTHTGWWHAQRTMVSQTGNLHGVNTEWWFRFEDGQACPELMQTITTEDGQFMESKLLIRESKFDDEKAAGQTSAGKDQLDLVKFPDRSCPNLLNLSLERVEGMLKSAELDLFESAEAVIRGDHLVVTVVQVDPVRDELTVMIDLDNGFIVEEINRMYELDDDEFLGEVISQYQYDFYEQLPLEIHDQIEHALNS
jgi:hypothetical protein